MERLDEEHMVKMMISDVEGNRCRGRPKLEWMDGVRMASGEWGISGAGWVLQEIVNSKLRDIPGDNFWFDSSTGDSGSVGGLLQRAKL